MTTAYERESELTGSREEIAAVLRGVIDGLQGGTIRVSDGDEAATVDVPERVELEVELEVEDDETSLELELSWPTPEGEGVTVSSVDEPSGDGDGDESSVSVGPASATAAPARFELFADRADEWRWRLRHRNGNVIASSGEGYTRKHNAMKGLRSVRRNAPSADVTEDVTD